MGLNFVQTRGQFGSLVDRFSKKYIKTEVPKIVSGDYVRIGLQIREGQKLRVQYYQGLVIAVQGKGIAKRIRVRRAFKGFCSERLILVYSPQIQELKVLNHTSVRRSKLYYVRQLEGKRASILSGRSTV